MSVNKRVGATGKARVGRPKKDEIVVKPFIVHNKSNIKPENELMYAKEAIRNAQNIYKYYNREFPNPLNLDVKDLDKRAKAVWQFIFSTRGLDPEKAVVPGHNRVFDNIEEVLYAFETYTNCIKEDNFVREIERPDGSTGVIPIVPNQTNFARWLGVPRQRISDLIINDEAGRERYKHILSDCLSEGAMVGIYQSSSTMFTLKNMCDWADKYEDRTVKKDDILAVSEAEELMKQLGYARERATLEAPKPLLEGGEDNG